jgi:hypothetical protein
MGGEPTEEGLYGTEEGKNLDYKDKLRAQRSIATFVNNVFNGDFPFKKYINFEQYCHINKHTSSEMFLSLMSLLH